MKKKCLYEKYPAFWDTNTKGETPCVRFRKLLDHYDHCKSKVKEKVFKIINKEMDKYYE